MMAGLGDAGLEVLFGGGSVRVLARGEALFRQDEPATAIFQIVRGRVRMIRNLASGDRVTIHTGRAGELFAEGALFSNVYHCDAVAAEAARVRSCGKAEVFEALGKSPTTLLALLERVTRLLHHARSMLELRNIGSAEERVLQHLRLSMSRENVDRIIIFDRPLLEVAADLGLTHEVYYRVLAELARDGLIERDGRKIRLIK